MALFDLSLTELQRYRSASAAPDDFDAFWARTIDESRAVARPASIVRVDTGLTLVETYDVTFTGFAGEPVKAWLHLPAGTSGQVPGVVQFIGYGGGRGHAHEIAVWPLAGYAHLVMDTRGQGWKHAGHGDTPDRHGAGPSVPGMLSKGITDPDGYYYRRVFADAVRAVDTLREHPSVDDTRIAVTGTSQGGGIAIAAAALAGGVAAAMPDVPFLCDIPRGITLTDAPPYREVADYLAGHREHVEAALHTLTYIDGVHHAARAGMPSLFSVALMDRTCPPSTVYAAHHAWAGPSEISVYPFNQHEGGGSAHRREQLTWLGRLFSS